MSTYFSLLSVMKLKFCSHSAQIGVHEADKTWNNLAKFAKLKLSTHLTAAPFPTMVTLPLAQTLFQTHQVLRLTSASK